MTMEDKILFVDDDELVVTCFERLLGRRFNLETALGADEAKAALMHRGPYAVVVSDLRMPAMSGIELLTIARELSPHTVGVVLTGNGDFPGAEEALRSGVVFKFLDKPCNPEELQITLKEALARYRENLQARLR